MKVGTQTHYTTTIYNQPRATWNSTIFQDGSHFFKMAPTGPIFWTSSTFLKLLIFDYAFILILDIF